jgi:hypothetical protein
MLNLFVFLLLTCLFIKDSHTRTQKGKGKLFVFLLHHLVIVFSPWKNCKGQKRPLSFQNPVSHECWGWRLPNMYEALGSLAWQNT